MANQVFHWQVRILFIDTDASGRIHYTSMFRYFEAVEVEFFRAIGAMEERSLVAFPRVHVECDYRGAITFDDLLDVELRIGKLGRSSVSMNYRVLKAGVDVASGAVVIACTDRQTVKAISIPSGIREKLAPYVAE